MKRWGLVVTSVALFGGLPRAAWAQVATDVRPPSENVHYAGSVVDAGTTSAEPVREKVISRHDISPLVAASFADGVGGGLQLDASIFALRGSFTYMPLIAGVGENADGDTESVEVIHGYQVNADLLLFVWAPRADARIGFSGGYRYHDVLSHGVSWGLQGEVDLAKHATLVLSLSASLFPEGKTRALDALGNPSEKVDFVQDPQFMSGFGVGMRLPI